MTMPHGDPQDLAGRADEHANAIARFRPQTYPGGTGDPAGIGIQARGRILRAHAGQDGQGMHGKLPGQACTATAERNAETQAGQRARPYSWRLREGDYSPSSIAVGDRAGIWAEPPGQALQPYAWPTWLTDARFCTGREHGQPRSRRPGRAVRPQHRRALPATTSRQYRRADYLEGEASPSAMEKARRTRADPPNAGMSAGCRSSCRPSRPGDSARPRAGLSGQSARRAAPGAAARLLAIVWSVQPSRGPPQFSMGSPRQGLAWPCFSGEVGRG
jgi:hypothetical protein